MIEATAFFPDSGNDPQALVGCDVDDSVLQDRMQRCRACLIHMSYISLYIIMYFYAINPSSVSPSVCSV